MVCRNLKCLSEIRWTSCIYPRAAGMGVVPGLEPRVHMRRTDFGLFGAPGSSGLRCK